MNGAPTTHARTSGELQRLDVGPGVREALACTFERWNGKGFPGHVSGTAIPLAMRIVHLTHDMEAIGRLFSVDHAVAAARDRRDRTYDPELADRFVAHGSEWLERLRAIDPWDAVLAFEPEPRRLLDGEALDEALTVAADFIDLKSPFMGGHSRRCAELAANAARLLGVKDDAIVALRRGAQLRRLAADGVIESRATNAVLVAAGHGEGDAPVARRRHNPGGLSRREVDVLHLAARGLTTKEIADRLYISTKTTDHHIQHIYNKIGVSTRAAAALWAMQNAVVE